MFPQGSLIHPTNTTAQVHQARVLLPGYLTLQTRSTAFRTTISSRPLLPTPQRLSFRGLHPLQSERAADIETLIPMYSQRVNIASDDPSALQDDIPEATRILITMKVSVCGPLRSLMRRMIAQKPQLGVFDLCRAHVYDGLDWKTFATRWRLIISRLYKRMHAVPSAL